MVEIIEINQGRLQSLLDLYGVSEVDILNTLNMDRKNKISCEDVFSNNIKLSILKKIDRCFFDKGLSFYTDPTQLSMDKSVSVFFRKDNFKSHLTPADRWRINQIESAMNNLKAIEKLSDYKIARTFNVYTTDSNPQDVAHKIRSQLNMGFTHKKDKDFLTAFIFSLSQYSILVHEFVEVHNLKKKTTWEGTVRY